MIHPLLTLMFDLFLIGSAGSILAAMTAEYFANRGPAVGRSHAARPLTRAQQPGRAANVHTARQRQNQSFRVGARG
ncbi:MAG: hypothetical protein ABI305_01860 [Tepidiformaceae bacterium]